LLLIPVSLIVHRDPFSDIIRMFVHFFSVYLFGMFLSRYRTPYLDFARKYWIGLSIITILVLVLNIIYFDQYNNTLNYIQKMLFCCFFIYWLWRLHKYVPSFVSVLAELSFGIFFVHYYVLLVAKALYEKIFHEAIPGNILFWTIDLVIVLAGSVAFIKFVQKVLPKYSRNLIGC
jgi:peptidoglycan/LPS O-acetylase OafA/YrhL